MAETLSVNSTVKTKTTHSGTCMCNIQSLDDRLSHSTHGDCSPGIAVSVLSYSIQISTRKLSGVIVIWKGRLILMLGHLLTSGPTNVGGSLA